MFEIPAFLAVAAALAVKALSVGVPLFLVLSPFVLPQLFALLDATNRSKLLAFTKGAVLIVADLSKNTPTTVDDDIVKVLREVEIQLGRTLKAKEVPLVKSMAKAISADSRFPAVLGAPKARPIGSV